MNRELAQAAMDLLGTPFRLHGRDPHTGLDCVGLVAASLLACGREVQAPRGYAMRSIDIRPLLRFADANEFAPIAENGDVILSAVHPLQPHLLIAAPDGFIHAHAGLGRVTLMPAPLPWPIIRQWQLRDPET